MEPEIPFFAAWMLRRLSSVAIHNHDALPVAAIETDGTVVTYLKRPRLRVFSSAGKQRDEKKDHEPSRSETLISILCYI